MPTIVATTVVTFEAIDVAVFVTTFWTPPMSFEIRDCTSPVRVRVKNASESRCRWRKTAARRSCITRWPTWFESSVWTTPSAPVTIAIAIIPPACERQRPRVVAADRLEHALEQERRDDAERGRDDDQQQDAAEPQPVRREEAADPAQVRAADRRVGGALGRRVGRVEEHAHRRSGYAAHQAGARLLAGLAERVDRCRFDQPGDRPRQIHVGRDEGVRLQLRQRDELGVGRRLPPSWSATRQAVRWSTLSPRKRTFSELIRVTRSSPSAAEISPRRDAA